MEMVVGVVVWSFSAVLWMCDRWWVMVLAGSMVKIKGEGMLSFFFLVLFLFLIAHIFLSLVNCFFNFPSECFFFSQLFFSFSLSHFYSIFPLHFFLFFPQIFVITFFISTIFFKSLPFFCYGTFLFMYPSHFLPSSALFSILFLFFFSTLSLSCPGKSLQCSH